MGEKSGKIWMSDFMWFSAFALKRERKDKQKQNINNAVSYWEFDEACAAFEMLASLIICYKML